MKVVISLGGSLIVPNKVDYRYLSRFKRLIKKLCRRHKVVIVTGGGKTARNYISALGKVDVKTQCWVGIASTKLNARLVAGYLGLVSDIPDSLSEVRSFLNKRNLVVCGALGFQPNMTSDGDAAQIAAYIKADYFVNLTDVDGLYDKNPKRFKDARFIPLISYKDFNKIVAKIDYKAGQHFVLDQSAAKIISKSKVKTIIMNGYRLNNFVRFVSGKRFKGTLIS